MDRTKRAAWAARFGRWSRVKAIAQSVFCSVLTQRSFCWSGGKPKTPPV
jgi:hypothetical protein